MAKRVSLTKIRIAPTKISKLVFHYSLDSDDTIHLDMGIGSQGYVIANFAKPPSWTVKQFVKELLTIADSVVRNVKVWLPGQYGSLFVITDDGRVEEATKHIRNRIDNYLSNNY